MTVELRPRRVAGERDRDRLATDDAGPYETVLVDVDAPLGPQASDDELAKLSSLSGQHSALAHAARPNFSSMNVATCSAPCHSEQSWQYGRPTTRGSTPQL